jgi:xanthine dehydrogenase YagS FAD-binding subunit
MNLFTHVNATSVADATTSLAKANTQVIAGGTDLLCYLRNMCSPNPPTALVNIKTIVPSLDYIKEEGGMLKIGATTTLTEIANNAVVLSKYTALAQAAQLVSSPELRNIGTIGGNICQKPRCNYFRFEYNEFPCVRKVSTGACPAIPGVNTYHSIFGAVNGCWDVCPSDTAPALVALNASIVTNKKTWKAADFFVIPAATGVTDVRVEQINSLAAGEIVTEIQVPTPAAGTKSTYLKFAFRKAMSFPQVSVAAVVTTSGASVSAASIVLGGVYPTPKVATAAQTSITGKSIDATSAAAAGTAAITGAAQAAPAVPNQNPGNKWKIQITQVLVKRALLAVK